MSYTGKDNLDIMTLAVNYNNYIYRWVDECNYNNILDFGAGNGEYCNRINPNKICAIELDDQLRANLKCKSYKDLEDLEDNEYDLIYSLNVLEHIEDDFDIVKKLALRLNNNGCIKILVPARMELYSEMDKKVGHYRRYNKQELIDLLERANFEVIEYKYFDFVGYVLSLLYKMIDNSGNINPSTLKIYDKYLFPVSVLIDKLTFGKLIGKNLMIIARLK